MLICKNRYSILFKAIAVVLVCLFLASNVAFAIPAGTTEAAHVSTLAVMSANERGIPHEMRALAYQKEFNEKLSPLYGGKNSWDKILEGLSEKIGFFVPGSTRFTIEDIWAKFIKANEALVKEGNDRIEDDLKTHGKVSEETIGRLNELSRRFIFPKELELAIRAHTAELKGWVIARSSGRHEDSYLRSLAGIFISPRKRDERLVVQGVKEILKHAIERIWLTENRNETKTEGVPNLLTPEDGFGILIQPFLQFEASGTAMTNFYGHTSIEAAIGDAEMAVKGIHANVAQFLFNKNNPSHFEYNPSFLTLPYQVRLKGNEYCVDDDPEAMREAIQNYPKINGKLSPINEAQARELNKVVSALEAEIGVPLDVEWGFLDNKLYIIQIRPIIGDFKKPLVEISPELKTKEPIAQTPIALGHTAPGGFTGKMVVVGNNVSGETVRQFEDEFGKEYIRVQSDIASAILGTKTKAKVLVDPEQGSRQAHNINLITGRIATGEFAYCNGPILKNDLLRNLTFIPHPQLKGVWISSQEVTYFADGLKGVFYESGKRGETLRQNDAYTRQGALIEFHDRVKDAWLKDSVDMPEHAWMLEMMRIFRYGAYFGRTTEEMFVDMLNAQNCNLDFVRRKIMASEYDENDFEQIQHELNVLEEALSFPLYPSEWENPRLKSLKNLLFLKDISKKLREETQPRAIAAIPQQYSIFLVDPYDSDEGIKKQLEESVEGSQVVRIGSKELLFRLAQTGMRIHLDQMPSLQAANTISAIYLHVNSYYDFSSLFGVLTKIRQENPDALIIVDGNTLSRNQFREFEQRYGRIFLKFNGVFEQHDVAKLVEEDHSKWVERKTATQEPQKAQKLKILIIDDDTEHTADFGQLVTMDFPECEIEAASNAPDAIQKLNAGQYDVIFFDMKFPGLDTITEKLKKSNGKLIAQSALSEETVKERGVIDEELFDRLFRYLKKPYSVTDEVPPLLAQLRKEQIEAYDKALAEWRKQHGVEAPIVQKTKPPKFSLLVLEDNELVRTSVGDHFRSRFAADEYELFFVGSYAEGLEIVQQHNITAVLIDLNLPSGPRRAFVDSIVNVPHIMVISGFAVRPDQYKMEVRARLGLDIANKAIAFDRDSDTLQQLETTIKKFREDQLKEWQSVHPHSIISTLPTKPKQLRILYIEDDANLRTEKERYFKREFDGKEYEFKVVDSVHAARKALWDDKYDVAIFDVVLPGFDDQFKGMLSGVPNLIVLTGLTETATQQSLGDEIYKHIVYFEKGSYELEELDSLLKKYRQQQLKTYEKALAEWKTRQPRPAPGAPTAMRPERISVLVVVDNNILPEYLTMKVFSKFADTDVKFCSCATEVVKYLKDNKVDLLISDYVLPDRPGEEVVVYEGIGKDETTGRDENYGLDRVLRAAARNEKKLSSKIDKIVFSGLLNDRRREHLKRRPDILLTDARHEELAGLLESAVKKTRQRVMQEQNVAPQSIAVAAPARPEKLRVLWIDDDAGFLGGIQRPLKVILGEEEYDFTFVNTAQTAKKKLSSMQFDVVIYDVKSRDFENTLKDAKFKERLLRSPELIALSGLDETSGIAAMGEELAKRSEYIQKGARGYNSFERVCTSLKKVRQQQVKGYEKALAEWQDRQPQTAPQAIAMTAMPSKPEKLRILIASDEDADEDLLYELEDLMGNSDYEFAMAGNYADAFLKLWNQKFDGVIFDWKMHDVHTTDLEPEAMARLFKDKPLPVDMQSSSFSNLFYRQLANVPNISIRTGASHNEVVEHISRVAGKDVEKRVKYGLMGIKAKDINDMLKGWRQKQIQTYEKALAEWQATQTQKILPALGAPIKPEGISILFISDEEGYREDAPGYFRDISNAKLKVCSNASEAIDYIKSHRVDMVIADYNIPMANETSDDTTYSDANIQAVLTTAKETAEATNRNIALVVFSAWFEEHQKAAIGGISKSIQLFLSTQPRLFQKFIDVAKQTQQKLIEEYDQALAQWQTAQAMAPAVVQQPEKPEKLTVLCVEDEKMTADQLRKLLEESFDSGNYRFLIAESTEEGLRALAGNRIDFVIVDLMTLTTELGAAISKIPNITIFSGYDDKKDIAEKASGKIASETLKRTNILSKAGIEWVEQIVSGIKQARQKQIEAYEENLAKWRTMQSQVVVQKEPVTTKGQTIFVLANSSAEAKALAKLIQDQKGESCTVTSMESVWYLERELRTARPDVVVADTIIDNKDEAENIMRLVRAKNPDAKFIFTSEEAALAEDNPKGENVLAILEKPFHFHDVISVMSGTYGNKTSAAGVKFQIQESASIVNSVEKAHTIDKPGMIRIWEGYAAPQFQKSMLTRIRTKTENGPYQVGFDKDIENLVTIACDEAKNDNAVTILPYNKLTKSQRGRLESAGAHIIYIDFKDGIELGTDDITQLGAIVFTGIAYLNNNDHALMSLYRLLTGQRHDLVTIEDLKKHPNLLTFILEPAAVHDYNELRQLNELMEREILEAA